MTREAISIIAMKLPSSRKLYKATPAVCGFRVICFVRDIKPIKAGYHGLCLKTQLSK